MNAYNSRKGNMSNKDEVAHLILHSTMARANNRRKVNISYGEAIFRHECQIGG